MISLYLIGGWCNKIYAIYTCTYIGNSLKIKKSYIQMDGWICWPRGCVPKCQDSWSHAMMCCDSVYIGNVLEKKTLSYKK